MDVLRQAPALSIAEAVEIARRVYGLETAASTLPSERDQNFALETRGGERFVLKMANAADGRGLLDAQNAAIEHVGRKTPLCQRVIPAIDGRSIADAGGHAVRLLTWLPGEPIASLSDPPPALFEDLGRAVAELDAALDDFDHAEVHRPFYWDLAGGLALVHDLAPSISEPRMRAFVRSIAGAVQRRDGGRLPLLPRAVRHNDLNDHNVLVNAIPSGAKSTVTGILDFGDIVYTYAIADLAVAMAYAILGKADPLPIACAVVRGYQKGRPIEDDEIDALFGLVELRLCMSVSIAARQQMMRPDNGYLSISQNAIRDTLPRLLALDRDAIDAALRQARARARTRPGHTLAARRRLVGRNLSISYRRPVSLVRGWMQYVYDESGRRYLDAYNNVPHVGHSHPHIVEAAAEQMRVLNTNTRYLHDNLVRYAERLIATLPEPLRVCYFVNSGSEANELALRLARARTRRRGTIVLDAAYHGNTATLIAISPYKFDGPGGEGRPAWVRVVPIPDVYRGEYKADDARAGARYAEFVARAAGELGATEYGLAAFIAESAPSVGGQIILPSGYLAAAYDAVREAGGVAIADEVQTAYGRIGTHFYAFQSQGTVPDVVVLGKPIGNGYPLGAVVTTPEIAASFDNGMEFFSTFGGSTVSCAVGLAVLDVVETQHLQRHAHDVGAALLRRLSSLADHENVGDIRGSGLFVGIELVTDRRTLEPATEMAAAVANRMRDEGVLLGTDGPFANVLKIRPPMPFDGDDAELLAATLTRVLAEAHA
ncbi:MAG: aminotransferase class III-fold pyridoxal phosphate-dependent enzyme [Vicinamibacterales bacterium]